MENHSEEYLRTKQRIKNWLDIKIEEDILVNYAKNNVRKRLITIVSSCMAAATILGAVVFYGLSIRSNKDVDITWHEVTTKYGEKKSALLPDGTTVWAARMNSPSASAITALEVP